MDCYYHGYSGYAGGDCSGCDDDRRERESAARSGRKHKYLDVITNATWCAICNLPPDNSIHRK